MKKLAKNQEEALFETLKSRFEQHMDRHPDVDWSIVIKKLLTKPEKLWSLYEMERTGGEPDVIDHDQATNSFIFYDCSKESPTDRQSLCYDREALESRKKFKPENSALDMATGMGITLLTEDDYMTLQQLGHFDTKTSSWLQTPTDVREHGGAIFGDFRFGRVFIYHNGADSYYAARGFRGKLKV